MAPDYFKQNLKTILRKYSIPWMILFRMKAKRETSSKKVLFLQTVIITRDRVTLKKAVKFRRFIAYLTHSTRHDWRSSRHSRI